MKQEDDISRGILTICGAGVTKKNSQGSAHMAGIKEI